MSISPDWYNLSVSHHLLGLGDIGSDCDGISAVLSDLGGCRLSGRLVFVVVDGEVFALEMRSAGAMALPIPRPIPWPEPEPVMSAVRLLRSVMRSAFRHRWNARATHASLTRASCSLAA